MTGKKYRTLSESSGRSSRGPDDFMNSLAFLKKPNNFWQYTTVRAGSTRVLLFVPTVPLFCAQHGS